MPLEFHTAIFTEITNHSSKLDSSLCTFFLISLNEECMALLSGGRPRDSFATFVEWVLVSNKSSFTISLTEEQLTITTPHPEPSPPSACCTEPKPEPDMPPLPLVFNQTLCPPGTVWQSGLPTHPPSLVDTAVTCQHLCSTSAHHLCTGSLVSASRLCSGHSTKRLHHGF